MRISKKSLVTIGALTFVSASFVSQALELISDNLKYANQTYYSGQTGLAEYIPEENTKFEITKVEHPQKVIRGGFFELVVYIRSEKRVYGNYGLAVNLFNVNNNTRIKTGKYQIDAVKDWPKDTIVKIGPFMVSVPPQAPLGESVIEVEMLKNSNAQIKASYAKSTIEVVSYNLR